jgi:rhamnogalacturonan endolyase
MTLVLFAASTQAAKQMEYLDRGVIAISSGNGVYVGWRMLGDDPTNIGFNVYRNSTKLNSSPITNSTNYFDASGTTSATYSIRAVVSGTESGASNASAVWANPHTTLNLQRPGGSTTPSGEAYTYSPSDLSVGDLDGDGQYEVIVKWEPSNSKDNSQSGYTGNVYIDAYTLNGTQLWRIDLGRNIRAGAHYTQFIVYDLDGDGKAEIAMKTADGTRDGAGVVIGNANADYRSSAGYVLTGPEFLTVFNGQTGRAMATTNYLPARGTVSAWGDNYGNRVDRFLAGVAYLDGTRPSLIMTRGYYTRAVVVAWDWRNGQLAERWTFDSNSNGNSAYAGQGAHSLTIGDVDNDGRDEIVFGAATIDDNGRGLYSTGLGHGDALHLGDFLPSRPGLEVFMVHECPSCYGQHGVEMHDARTGQIIWSHNGGNTDIGRGVTMDIDPRYAGSESWASSGGLYAANGTLISSAKPNSANFGAYWDADLHRELLNGTLIDKWNYASSNTSRLLTAYSYGAAQNNGTKATPGLSADILGDWREEVIWRHDNNSQLLIFSTTAVTTHKLRTLMHDSQYRTAIAWQNVAYNQPPHTSYFLGEGMAAQPTPDIYFVGTNPNPPLGDTGSSSSSSSSEAATIANGTYIIESRSSGKVLTVSGNSTVNGANVVQSEYVGQPNQHWRVDAVSSGYFTFRPEHSNGSLDIAGLSSADGASIIQSNYSGDQNQTWSLQSAGDNYYGIMSLLSGKAVDVEARSQADGGNIIQWTYNAATNQQWSFTRVTGGTTGSVSLQENAVGFCAIEGTIDNNHPGFTGTGFANVTNSTGTGINWRVDAGASDEYTLLFRYASVDTRPGRLLVDGTTVATIDFPATGGWTSWGQVSVSVNLNAGVRSLRLEGSGATSLGNIDSLTVTGASPQAASCTATSSSSSVASSVASSSSSSSSSNASVCNWYGTNFPMCVNQTVGWGWENQQSCIGVTTCNSQ